VKTYLSLLHVADLVFEADESVLYVGVVALVGGGHLKGELGRGAGGGLQGAPSPYSTMAWRGGVPGRGRRPLHHGVQV